MKLTLPMKSYLEGEDQIRSQLIATTRCVCCVCVCVCVCERERARARARAFISNRVFRDYMYTFVREYTHTHTHTRTHTQTHTHTHTQTHTHTRTHTHTHTHTQNTDTEAVLVCGALWCDSVLSCIISPSGVSLRGGDTGGDTRLGPGALMLWDNTLVEVINM